MTRRVVLGHVFILFPSCALDCSPSCSALLAKAPEKRKYAGDDVQRKVQEMHGMQEIQESAGDDVQWKEHIK